MTGFAFHHAFDVSWDSAAYAAAHGIAPARARLDISALMAEALADGILTTAIAAAVGADPAYAFVEVYNEVRSAHLRATGDAVGAAAAAPAAPRRGRLFDATVDPDPSLLVVGVRCRRDLDPAAGGGWWITLPCHPDQSVQLPAEPQDDLVVCRRCHRLYTAALVEESGYGTWDTDTLAELTVSEYLVSRRRARR